MPSEGMPAATPDTALWQELGWQPSPEQLQQLLQLQEELRSWNSRVNLTPNCSPSTRR